MANQRKAIFITGGGSGIGRATAKYFADRDWFVGLADISETGMKETGAMLPDGQFSTHMLDVTDRDQWARAVAEFSDASGGRMDMLFNNAGIGIGGQLEEMPNPSIDKQIAINFNGVVHGGQACFDLLKATDDSCIVNTASAAGIYGVSGLSIYSATKFAVRGLSESWDMEFAPHGIKVRALMPGFIDTPILDTIAPGSNESAREKVREAGLEFTPVEVAAETVWNAPRSKKVHLTVGKTAKRLAFLARWMPSMLANRGKGLLEPSD